MLFNRISNLFVAISLVLCLYHPSYAQTIDLSKVVGTSSASGGSNGSGGAYYSIPIRTVPAAHDLIPKVSLDYNSQSGDGVAGMGWRLSALSYISRAGKDNYYNGITAPVKYTNTDDAFLLDGQRMFVTSGTNGANGAAYGVENMDFSKIESFGGSEVAGPDWFKVTTKEGLILEYGNASTAVFGTDVANSHMLWFLNKVTDKFGNYYTLTYTLNATDRTFLLSEIDYGGNVSAAISPMNRLVFSYTQRTNWKNVTTYDGGYSLRACAYNLSSIQLINVAQVVATYSFEYTQLRDQYFLTKVTEAGTDGTKYNPLVFTYGTNTSTDDVSISAAYGGSIFALGNVYAGDFNGDGRQDIMTSNKSYDNNGVPHYASYNVTSNFTTYNGQPAVEYFYGYTIPSSIPNAEVQGSSNGYYNFGLFDYDGDGKEDVTMISNLVSGSDRIYNGLTINYSRVYSVYTGTSYATTAYNTLPHASAYANDFKYIYHNGTTWGSFYVPGDFDGDGAEDYILILGLSGSASYKAFFSSPKKGIVNSEIVSFGVEGTSTDPFYATSVASAKQVLPVDFDGDGKQELLVVKNNQSYILSVFPVSVTSGYNYGASVLYTFTDIKTDYPIYPGDFNGDGKTDILYRSAPHTSTAAWFTLISTGKSFVSSSFAFTNRPYLPGDGGGSAHHLMVADLNGDGKSDIWHSLDLSATSSRHVAYYSTGTAFNYEGYAQSVSINGSEQANTVEGDFNGDGKPDMLGISGASGSTVGRFIYPKPFREEKLLKSVTNGLGAVDNFYYDLTSNNYNYSQSVAYDYDVSGTAPGAQVNGNPYNVTRNPQYILTQFATDNGIGGFHNYYYTYKDAAFHRIKGFLGFKSMTTTDGATGVAATREMEIHPSLLVPYLTHAVVNSPSGPTAMIKDITVTSNFQQPNTSYFDKRFFVQEQKRLTQNGLTGAAEEVSNTYDDYGNITQSITKLGAIGTVSTSPVETRTINTTFGIHATPVPAVPETITNKNERSGQAAYTTTSKITYLTNGGVDTRTAFYGLTNARTTTYVYDNFGNTTQITESAAGVTSHLDKYTFDNTGRFMLTHEKPGSGVTKKEVYTYDLYFGNLLSKKEEEGLTTAYTYDAFGRLKTSLAPENYTISMTYVWESTVGRYSVNTTRPGGGRNVKTYYDVLGRDVRKEESGFGGSLLTSSTTYDIGGRVKTFTRPHYSNETAVTETNQYDENDRLTQVSDGATSHNYTFTKLAGGQYQETETTSAGLTKYKVTDPAGLIVSAGDLGGTLGYTYDSQGNLLQSTVNGGIAVSATYDDYGNRLTMNDRNAGSYGYKYDAFGRVVTQTSPLSQSTTYNYDVYDRLTSRVGPDGTTSYEYFNDVSSGNSGDMPSKITGFSGDVTEYTYDALRRLSTEKKTFDGLVYNTSYEYDTYSNMTKKTYPSGLAIGRSYDHDGAVTTVSLVSGSTGTTLFTGSAMNSLGKYTSYAYGNGASTSENYNFNLRVPTAQTTASILQYTYNFDATTGNLTSRKDVLKNLEDEFTYDNLNRLLTTKVNNIAQTSTTYDGASSSTLGNIATKSDAGNYTYNTSKVNALAYITNPAGAQVAPANISTLQQDITYNAFMQPATLAENGYTLEYIYGNDYQRIRSVLKQGTTQIDKKYYFGDYETQLRGTTQRSIHYIPGGNGLCAILVQEAGVTKIYYTHTDYLGNILAITDQSKAVVASQNFDAWGRPRNPANWSYTAVPTVPDWVYRGFTGHEQLKEFSLVNMNGRIYDPIIGRMLSADNYTQEHYNTQSYNRYAYANNNPLVNTDPTGQLFIGTIAAGIYDFFVTGFTKGGFEFWRINSGTWDRAWSDWNTKFNNHLKVDLGIFQTDHDKTFLGQVWQVTSRMTYQHDQQELGNILSHAEVDFNKDVEVSYFYGATLVSRKIGDGKFEGVTLGSYINGKNLQASGLDYTFKHEFGHTLQSQIWGPLYFGKVAIPSILTAHREDAHSLWIEANASILSNNWFNKHHPELNVNYPNENDPIARAWNTNKFPLKTKSHWWNWLF